MPIRRFRTVEEMTPPREARPLGPDNLRAAIELSRTCLALAGNRRPPAGVHKHRSAEDAWRARLRWEQERPPTSP